MNIKFGPAGTGSLFIEYGGKSSLDVPKFLSGLSLTAFEYQCGHGVNIGREKALTLGEKAREYGISLSLHAPYYISLSSAEEEKRNNSIRYILDSARAADAMGASRIVVHSGSVGKFSREHALTLAKDTLQKALNALDEQGYSHIALCPETMGKINQLGTLSEVMELCGLDERLIPCVDFGHLNARGLGSIKDEKDYEEIFSCIENELGFYRLKVFHSHFSKIEYSKGGEKRHLTFEDTLFGPDYEPLINLILKKGLAPTVICESGGTQEADALKMQAFAKNLERSMENEKEDFDH